MNMTKKGLLMGVLVAAASSASMGAGFDGLYMQNFNAMGTGTTAPADWAEYSITGSHDAFAQANSSTPGPLPTGSAIKGGTLNVTLIAGTPGTQRNAAGFNWAVGGSGTERALGTSPTGIAGSVLQLTLSNNTPNSITTLLISYDIRRFSVTSNNNSSYNASPYRGVEELPGYWLFYSLDNGATYSNVSALNPTRTGTTGVVVPNSIGTTSVPATPVTLTTAWNPGTNIRFRWFDDNAQSPSPDQLLGLDNVTIAIPEPASFGLLALGAAGMLLRRRQA